jgi:formylglycine-generating enzyme
MRKLMLCLIIMLSMVNILVAQERGMSKSESLTESPYQKSWALLIGINKYPELPSQYQLSYAVNDVNDMKKVLLEQYQFPADNIITLTDKQATKQKINDAMGQLTDKNKIKPDDRVLVYFSGHGQTVPLQNSGEMGYLLPYDAKVDINDASNPSSYYTTCIGMDELRRLSQIIPAKHVLFLVDTCYSGLAINSSRSGLQTTVSNYLQKISSLKSRQIITAGLKGEESIEKPEWGHGAFTYKLLEALRTGVADENSDGVTTGLELASYLRNVVPNISPNQTPQYGYFEGEGEFMFIRKMPANPLIINEMVNTATLIVDSKPTGASVYVDDKEMGKTPCTVIVDAGIMGKRDIIVAISKDNYATKRANLQVEAGKITTWNEIQLKRNPAILTIHSDPSEASVCIDGDETELGRTPLTVTVDTGEDNKREITVKISKDGHKTKQSKLKLESGKETKLLDIHLEKLAKPEPDTQLSNIPEIIGKDGAPMILIPAGEFAMGDHYGNRDEKPVHKVYLDAFYMDKYEVTNEQYKKFLDSTKHRTPYYWNDARYNAIHQPVVGVNWYDAVAYCEWAGKRLPTEAEWEKAARGGMDSKKYVWGDAWPPPNNSGNFVKFRGYKDVYTYSSPVGSFNPNGYGLYDIAGNVWELYADWYDKDYYASSPSRNPKGPDSGFFRVMRDRGWDDAHNSQVLRVSSRNYLDPTPNVYIDVGFRCAMDVPK